jgi:uncharacterized protein (TIRG00374 family)
MVGVLRVVDVGSTVRVLQHNLGTPRAVLFGTLSGLAFLAAFSIRGVRWRLFLKPIGNVSVYTTVRLFLISTTVNFLLPVRGGEIVKTLMLKRVADIPVSRSLPSVAMDKSFDLIPALFIIVIVPLIGLAMDIKLWLVLGVVSALFAGIALFVALSALKPHLAVAALRGLTGVLPERLAGAVQMAAGGFVETVLSTANRRVFFPAVALTGVAVLCDSIFAMLTFWTVGFPIPFTTALFGYTLYNMFYVVPTPPGQLGSNEAVGLLVFGGLLHLPTAQVLAMFLFSHSRAAVLMCTSGPICLKSLKLTMPSIFRAEGRAVREAAVTAELTPANEFPSLRT